MDYCRLHTDILGDRKLMRAARQGARSLHLLPWFFAFARQAQDGGRLTVNRQRADPEDFLDLIPCVTAEQVEGCQREALDLGIMVEDPDGARRLVNYEKRNPKPSAQSRESTRRRVQKLRAKRRGNDPGNGVGNGEGNGAVTDQVTGSVTVGVTGGEESRVRTRDLRTVEIGNLEGVPGDNTDPGARDRQIRDRGLQLTAVIAAGGRS